MASKVFLLSLFLIPSLQAAEEKKSVGSQITFHYNNTYVFGRAYTVSVDKYTEYIMEFAGDNVEYETPARVSVASDFANRSYPLFITARQQKGVFSWQLPMLVQTPVTLEQFTNISRTLCPHNNLFSEDEDTCDVSSGNTPIVHLTSSSPEPINVTITVDTVSDFIVRLNNVTTLTSSPSQPKYYFYPFNQTVHGDFDLHAQRLKKKPINVTITVDTVSDFIARLNNVTTLTSSPSQPKYYFYPFNQTVHGDFDLYAQRLKKKAACKQPLTDSEQWTLDRHFVQNNLLVNNNWLSKPKSVIVMIESDDDICAVVSIQNYSCPVFDNERDILYDGYYLTMTRRGGITLTQDTFPYGFYIVFIVKTSDDDCIASVGSNVSVSKMASYFGWKESSSVDITTNDGRVKTFRFIIVSTISYQEYMIAAGAALAFFLSFYAAALIAILCQKRKQALSTEADSNEEGQLSSPDVPHNNVTVRVRRRNVGEGGHVDIRVGNNNVGSITVGNTSYGNMSGESSRNFAHGDEAARTEDGSSSSDTESDFSTLDDVNTDKDVYLLGNKLCVANLARCRPRVLSARSKMYLWNVLTVAVFYTLPVIQLVITYQLMLNQSGNQDLCYFNFFCAHPLMVLSDFNHVYSNLGYITLGVLFLLLVWRRHGYHRAKTAAQKELGIPQHFGLLYAMGIALVSEGMLSAAYHVCPNSMNFQFDTSFMYVTSVLCMVKIYQSRHPDINARAHATFGVLALIIFIGLVGVLNANLYFWLAFTILHLSTCLVMTFQIYYLGRFKMDAGMICRACRELVTRPLAAITPTHCGRCVMLIIANLANWAIAAYGVAQHSRDFASHLLLVLMSNLFLYTLFYIVMKLLHRESVRWYSWVFIALTYGVWFSSSYFYLDQSTNWALTPAESRRNNRVCSLLQLYDSHDVWHFLSSVAMFFSFNMYLTIDDNLQGVPRDKIMVF